MKTVGSLFKEARFRRKYSREKLGEITHIRPSFISYIENGKWGELPSFNITLGFVKTISHFLNVDENQAVSVFRREYPASLTISAGQAHKPVEKSLNKKISWGPRLTFFALIFIVILSIGGYLTFQYKKFNSPPILQVIVPKENQIISSSSLNVVGKTDPDSTVTVNNQFAIVDSNGNFSANIDVAKSTNIIIVVAKSRSGKESTINRRIVVKL